MKRQESILYEPVPHNKRIIVRRISPKVHLACQAHAARRHMTIRQATEHLIQAGFLAHRMGLSFQSDPYEQCGRNVPLINIAIHPQVYNLTEVYRSEHPCPVRYAIETLIKQGLAGWYKVHKL